METKVSDPCVNRFRERSLTAAAAASSTNPTTTNTPQGIRPRLVAKSTGGLGASALKNKLSGKNGIPDPMQVWNKNRGMETSLRPNYGVLISYSHPTAFDETSHGRGTKTAIWHSHDFEDSDRC
jgi:hypothetical protein